LKQFIIYLLLILFSAQSFEQVLIGLNFKLNQDYFASICTNKDKPELNCNGCCHLKKQLAQSEEDKSSDDKLETKKALELFVEYISVEIQKPNLNLLVDGYSVLKLILPSAYYYDIFHPPRI